MANFEKLETWQMVINFADLVYELTHRFRNDERFGLQDVERASPFCIEGGVTFEGGELSTIN